MLMPLRSALTHAIDVLALKSSNMAPTSYIFIDKMIDTRWVDSAFHSFGNIIVVFGGEKVNSNIKMISCYFVQFWYSFRK